MTGLTRTSALSATVISGLLVVADQVTKTLVRHTMALHDSISLLPSLNLTYTRNPGAAFSLFAETDATFRFWFFTLISIAALAMVIAFLRRVAHGDWWTLTALALILGGAIGNLIDRIRFGEVIDFIDVYVGTHHWPVFNLADSGITIGMVMLLGHLLLDKSAVGRPAGNL
jgi:signal peptidase II